MGKCIRCQKEFALFAVPLGPQGGICHECKPKCTARHDPRTGKTQWTFERNIWRQMLFPLTPPEMPEGDLIKAADALRDTLEAIETEIENRKDAAETEDLSPEAEGGDAAKEKAERPFLFNDAMASGESGDPQT